MTKEREYQTVCNMIRGLGFQKGWWDLDDETKYNSYYTNPMKFCNILLPKEIDEFFIKIYDKSKPNFISINRKPIYEKGSYYIQIARYSINDYLNKLDEKGLVELDTMVLEVIRKELPIITNKNYEIIFYSTVCCTNYWGSTTHLSAKKYLI